MQRAPAIAAPVRSVARTMRAGRSIPVNLPLGKAPYHSYEHEQPPAYTPSEDAILSAAMIHVPAHGFGRNALAQGARDAGYRDVTANLFPTGPFALVQYHLATQRRALAKSIPKQGTRESVDESVKRLAWQRLQANRAVIGRWQEALAIMALPANVIPSLRELGRLADEILFWAGDASVDTSWYTKRGAIGTVYASAELFMTTDSSPQFAETEAFLIRRLEGMRATATATSEVGAWLGVTGMGVLNSLRSKGVRI